jgi:hypothetical protein
MTARETGAVELKSSDIPVSARADALSGFDPARGWNHILEDGSFDHEWVTEFGATFCKHCEVVKPLEGE